MNTKGLYERMKEYEEVYKYKLINNMYSVIRLDGRSFKQYTKHLFKPFDKCLSIDMIETAKFLCNEIQNVKLAYTQSDEISLILTDFDNRETQPWFGNEIQKMCSISASLATAFFNQRRFYLEADKLGFFDARLFQLPNVIEVQNYLLQRQQDAVKNSISSCAQAIYSHNELHKKNSVDKQELIFQRGSKLKEKLAVAGFRNALPDKENFSWNDIPENMKRGTTIIKSPQKKYFPKEIFDKDRRSVEDKLSSDWGVDSFITNDVPFQRIDKYYKTVNQWIETPLDFMKDRNVLNTIISTIYQLR